MESAGSPWRTITAPAGTVRAWRQRVISPISEAVSASNRGTRAIMPQVTTNSRRWISSAKAVATMPTGRASIIRPNTMVTLATMRPTSVTGYTSP